MITFTGSIELGESVSVPKIVSGADSCVFGGIAEMFARAFVTPTASGQRRAATGDDAYSLHSKASVLGELDASMSRLRFMS